MDPGVGLVPDLADPGAGLEVDPGVGLVPVLGDPGAGLEVDPGVGLVELPGRVHVVFKDFPPTLVHKVLFTHIVIATATQVFGHVCSFTPPFDVGVPAQLSLSKMWKTLYPVAGSQLPLAHCSVSSAVEFHQATHPTPGPAINV